MAVATTRLQFLRWASAGAATAAVGGKIATDARAGGGGWRTSRINLIGVRADDGSVVVAQNVLDDQTVDITIDSAALGQTAAARLLLPASFHVRTRNDWPVLYLLHGGYGNYVAWTGNSDIERLARGRDVLFVMPDGGRLGFYTNWWNRGVDNKPGWETFHLTELRQILERGLGAGNMRAIAGLSMGGFGAISYAGRNPGFFRAAASFSGTLDTLHPTLAPVSPEPWATWFMRVHLAPNGYDPLDLWGDPTAQRAVWAAHNPADLVENLRGTKLYVSCGNGQLGPLDPPGTNPSSQLLLYEAAQSLQNLEFIRRATRLGLDITSEIYPGSHSWPYWARELKKAFPLLMEAIGA